jgi:uncharacterized protein YecE (DUF72 family)
MSQSLFDEAHAGGHAPVEPAAQAEDISWMGRHLPASVHLGTSSWSFPGWRGLVYEDEHTEARLARDGLHAYAQHPLLRTVGIDRGYYQALTAAEWTRYAHHVPEAFRFVVKAPSLVTDAVTRAAASGPSGGHASGPNPRFLDAAWTADHLVIPAVEGLRRRLGPLVLQFAPIPSGLTRDPHALIARLADFVARLPRQHEGIEPVYAIELRNPELLTPRLVNALREVGARLCVGIHARMPGAARQAGALKSMDAPSTEASPTDDWRLAGPLVVRWNLHAGLRYEQAKSRYAPFDRIVDPDLVTRGTLVHLIRVALRSGQESFVIVNNKAEGSAPLSCVEIARALLDRAAP